VALEKGGWRRRRHHAIETSASVPSIYSCRAIAAYGTMNIGGRAEERERGVGVLLLRHAALLAPVSRGHFGAFEDKVRNREILEQLCHVFFRVAHLVLGVQRLLCVPHRLLSAPLLTLMP